jgi:hypothetical protein
MAQKTMTLQTYVSDMHSLQKHIYEALQRQVGDSRVQAQTEAAQLLGRVSRTLEAQLAELERHLEVLGGNGAAASIKDAVTSALGLAAGLIDKVRAEAVSKMLRDDFTALDLAAAGYAMLHTTALGLRDQGTADLALRHLRQLTPVIMEMNELLPTLVLRELADDGLPVDIGAATQARRNLELAWRRGKADQKEGHLEL